MVEKIFKKTCKRNSDAAAVTDAKGTTTKRQKTLIFVGNRWLMTDGFLHA
jgi:hypothetical protein